MQFGVEISNLGHQIRVNYFCFVLRAHWMLMNERLGVITEDKTWKLKWTRLCLTSSIERLRSRVRIPIHTKRSPWTTQRLLKGFLAWARFESMFSRRTEFRDHEMIRDCATPSVCLKNGCLLLRFVKFRTINQRNVESKSVFTPSDGMPLVGIRLATSQTHAPFELMMFWHFPGRSTSNGT